MATYYLDFENGNDASAGTSWATAWKTLNNGATAARIAPGDEIRIAKTADPVSIGNATWTKNSATVTLATAQTTNIYLDGAWTAANSATSTTTTTRKEGSNAASITTAATTATSTKYAYLTIGGGSGVDFSSYDAITFWIRSASVAINANNYQIKLCSDTLGNTAVDTFDIPATAGTAIWIPMTLKRNGGGALGNSIQSIAWYTGTSSPGNSRNVFIDNVMGCDFDGLNLTSLISKNSAGYTDIATGDTWHGLQSIDGTTVILGNYNSLPAGDASLKGYWTAGTSPETVTTYIRPTYKFAIQSSASGSAQPIQDTGTAGNLITFSGGWDTSSNTQDGETWIDGQNGLGYAISLATNKSYLKFERLNACRFDRGFSVDSTSTTGHVLSNCQFINCTTGFVVGLSGATVDVIINNCSTPNNNPGANVFSSKITLKSYNNPDQLFLPYHSRYTKLIHNNSTSGFNIVNSVIDYFEYIDNAGGITGSAGVVNINEAVIKNCSASNTLVGIETVLNINKLTSSGNTNLGQYGSLLTVKQTNATSTQLIGSNTVAGSFRPIQYPALFYGAVNNDINDNRSYWQYGNALSQTTTRHTASGIAWQINITNTGQTTDFPIYFSIAKVACNANSLVTVKAWVKLSHATDIGAKLMIQANEIAGVSADVTATKSADTNWEELTITFTPTVAGVAQIYVQGYWLANLADESIYVDDITVTQA